MMVLSFANHIGPKMKSTQQIGRLRSEERGIYLSPGFDYEKQALFSIHVFTPSICQREAIP
jgi:hypothetical protein